jgi:hypothetical protein
MFLLTLKPYSATKMHSLRLRFSDDYYHLKVYLDEKISDLKSILPCCDLPEEGNLLITPKTRSFHHFDLNQFSTFSNLRPKDQQKWRK